MGRESCFRTVRRRRILDARMDSIATPRDGEEVRMFEIAVVLLAVLGAVWLFGALVVGAFKLTFGLLGMIFGGLFGLFALAVTALVVIPVVLFAMLPVLLPALCVVGLVWLIVHASRPHAGPPQGNARPG
jgi:hypothetical protein